MPVTMDHIAKRVGVSKTAVSLALNGKPGVSPELRENIRQTAAELGYQLPDRRPSEPASDKKSIAVVHREHADFVSQPAPVFVKYLEGIQKFIGTYDINLTLSTNYGTDEAQTLGLQLLEGGQIALDGIILMGLSAHREGRVFRRFFEREIPMVVIGRRWPDLPVNTISQDHYLQAALALDHLVQLGHRKIAFVSRWLGQEYDWFAERLQCYKETLIRIGEPVDEELIIFLKDADRTEAIKALVQQRPDITAVFATDDTRAVDVMQGLREAGLRIPQDVSVIGLDDSVKSPSGYPALTTVALPAVEIGYLAAELLLKHIENRHYYYSHIVLRTELIERDSCAVPPS